ncbi:MAG: hypothetical protein R3314_09050 [Longimicrobiales bacterium]|nr:hypothetical protein [Longimicrobiales bacterium]
MNARNLFRTGVEWCGVLLLVVVTLPILAAVAFVLRFAALGVVLVGTAAVLVGYCLYPPLRRRANEAGRSVTGRGGS